MNYAEAKIGGNMHIAKKSVSNFLFHSQVSDYLAWSGSKRKVPSAAKNFSKSKHLLFFIRFIYYPFCLCAFNPLKTVVLFRTSSVFYSDGVFSAISQNSLVSNVRDECANSERVWKSKHEIPKKGRSFVMNEKHSRVSPCMPAGERCTKKLFHFFTLLNFSVCGKGASVREEKNTSYDKKCNELRFWQFHLVRIVTEKVCIQVDMSVER